MDFLQKGTIKEKDKQFFTLAQVMGRDMPKHRWHSKMCLESGGVAAKFRMSAPVIQPAAQQTRGFSLP